MRLRELIDGGAPWEACDVFRTAVAGSPADPELLFLGALAHARAGATHEAHALLDQAEPLARETRANSLEPDAHAPDLLTDILSLRGRLWKDLVHRASSVEAALAFVQRARAEYLAAYAISHDPFPGVNAATLARLLGEADTARTLAAEVIATRTGTSGEASAWELASLGEAQLVAGHPDLAQRSYAGAFRACHANAGVVASMRRQLTLLARVLPAATAVRDAIPQASVVAFAGHMIDGPNRAPPRFPAHLETRVAHALRERVAAMRSPIVYASAACGADLLFAEAVLDRGAELNLVLPFDRDDFLRTSVATAGEAWIRRFDSALARASRVVMATEERYLGDDTLFDHAARIVDGLAILRAAQLETEPTMVGVADREDIGRKRRPGGTGATLARWRSDGRAIDVIDLGALRRAAEPAGAAARLGADRGAAIKDRSGRSTRSHAPRSIRSMLFADIAGYSRLHDAELPAFQRTFLALAASLMEGAGRPPLEAKTWGDGLYLVFEEPGQAAEWALRFAEAMRDHRTKAGSAGDALAVRVALHAGAVFRAFDPVMRRDSHFGANVTRAARIEPVTPPGLVYASEAFAATLASGNSSAYALEYVGVLPLAKGYGDSRIYRLERR